MSRIVNDDDNKVFIATGNSGDKNVGFVITWVSEASLNNIILVVSKFNDSLKIIEQTKQLCLNLLSFNQIDEFVTFGSKSSFSYDKFASFKFDNGLCGLELDLCSGYAHCIVNNIFETPDRKILYCTIEKERETGIPPMLLSEAIELLTVSQKSDLINKYKRDFKRDEEQFVLL